MAVVSGLGLQQEDVMGSKPAGKVLKLLVIIALFVAIGFVDWHRFFPLSAHTDLRFQAIGESIEVLFFLGILLWAFGFAEQRRKAASGQISDGMKALAATVFAVGSLATNWRDFFPNNLFNLSAGAGDIVGAIFMGALSIGLFFGTPAFASHKSPDAPPTENEKSIV
jgi:hypothetical protein